MHFLGFIRFSLVKLAIKNSSFQCGENVIVLCQANCSASPHYFWRLMRQPLREHTRSRSGNISFIHDEPVTDVHIVRVENQVFSATRHVTKIDPDSSVFFSRHFNERLDHLIRNSVKAVFERQTLFFCLTVCLKKQINFTYAQITKYDISSKRVS